MESAAQTPEYQELEQKHARHLNMLQENVSLNLFPKFIIIGSKP